MKYDFIKGARIGPANLIEMVEGGDWEIFPPRPCTDCDAYKGGGWCDYREQEKPIRCSQFKDCLFRVWGIEADFSWLLEFPIYEHLDYNDLDLSAMRGALEARLSKVGIRARPNGDWVVRRTKREMYAVLKTVQRVVNEMFLEIVHDALRQK